MDLVISPQGISNTEANRNMLQESTPNPASRLQIGTHFVFFLVFSLSSKRIVASTLQQKYKMLFSFLILQYNPFTFILLYLWLGGGEIIERRHTWKKNKADSEERKKKQQHEEEDEIKKGSIIKWANWAILNLILVYIMASYFIVYVLGHFFF